MHALHIFLHTCIGGEEMCAHSMCTLNSRDTMRGGCIRQIQVDDLVILSSLRKKIERNLSCFIVKDTIKLTCISQICSTITKNVKESVTVKNLNLFVAGKHIVTRYRATTKD
jgi:hypothetical protein